MAVASFEIRKCVGVNAATESDSNKEVYLYSTDTANTSNSYPISIPKTDLSSPKYSAETWIRLYMSQKANNNTENFKCWGPDSSVSAFVNILMGSTATARDPLADDDSLKSTATDGGPYRMATVDAFYYSAGTGVQFTGSTADSMNAVGSESEYIVLQLVVAKGASSGNIETQTFSISYDES